MHLKRSWLWKRKVWDFCYYFSIIFLKWWVMYPYCSVSTHEMPRTTDTVHIDLQNIAQLLIFRIIIYCNILQYLKYLKYWTFSIFQLQYCNIYLFPFFINFGGKCCRSAKLFFEAYELSFQGNFQTFLKIFELFKLSRTFSILFGNTRMFVNDFEILQYFAILKIFCIVLEYCNFYCIRFFVCTICVL